MSELRDKVKALLHEAVGEVRRNDDVDEDWYADAILAIPEIAEAQEWWRVFKDAEPMEISTAKGIRKGLILP